MSSSGFGTCSTPSAAARVASSGRDTRPRGADSTDVTAGHGLTGADKWPSGLVFLPVEAERLAVYWRHRSFGVILLFCRLSWGNMLGTGVDGGRYYRALTINRC